MTDPAVDVSELFITGVTADGPRISPERLGRAPVRRDGLLSTEGEVAMYAHLGYSPYVKPTTMNGISGILLNDALKDIEPKAYEFVLSFAQDNGSDQPSNLLTRRRSKSAEVKKKRHQGALFSREH